MSKKFSMGDVLLQLGLRSVHGQECLLDENNEFVPAANSKDWHCRAQWYFVDSR
jgi:hypothetical protein